MQIQTYPIQSNPARNTSKQTFSNNVLLLLRHDNGISSKLTMMMMIVDKFCIRLMYMYILLQWEQIDSE